MAELLINRESSQRRHGMDDVKDFIPNRIGVNACEAIKHDQIFGSSGTRYGPAMAQSSSFSSPHVSSASIAKLDTASIYTLYGTDSAMDIPSLGKVEGRILPGLLSNGATFHLRERHKSCAARALEGNHCLEGTVNVQDMINAGLKWWIPPCFGTSHRGALCDIVTLWERTRGDTPIHEECLAKLLRTINCGTNDVDDSFRGSDEDEKNNNCSVDVSFQRWPAKKVELRERSKKKSCAGECKAVMDMGFSAAALQEMQLLSQIHNQIFAPQGHPNFVLPVVICTPTEDIMEKERQNNYANKHLSESFFLVFEQTPFSSQKILNHSKRRNSAGVKDILITPVLFSAWMCDVMCALAHAHMNSIVFRTVHPDQILINRVGELKISNLARTIVIPHDER